MKNKIHNLLFIGFLCVLLYSVLFYFTKEGFSESDSYGQWELLLRQTYNDEHTISPFEGLTTAINAEALYDSYGKITSPNYYNSKLLSNYDFSDKYIFKLNMYEKSEKELTNGSGLTWSQGFDNDGKATNATITTDPPPAFLGLDKNVDDDSYIFKQNNTNDNNDTYVLGASKTYLDNISTTTSGESIIPGADATSTVEKTELYLWNPRPKNKNTFNGNYDDLTIQKVDMNETEHTYFWNQSEGNAGTIDEDDLRYSYCFGKLKCNDNIYDPIKNENDTYKPYCNSDSINNPVYCEGSILYNTSSESLKNVPMDDLEYDIMGKYASYDDIETQGKNFNLFRGLTTPYPKDYVDPEISGNDVIITENEVETKINICDFLDNQNLDNGTNIQEECKEKRKSKKDTQEITIGKKCIADYGDMINSKYADYVCKEGETCIGYKCGSQYGNCKATLL